MDLSVVRAEHDHIDDIKNIAQAAWELMCPNLLTEDDIYEYLNENYKKDDLEEWIIHDGTWFYMLLDDDRAVGFCQLTRKPEEKNIAVFRRFLLLPDYQDHKIAYKLFQAAVKDASTDGVTEVEINIPECSKKWRDIFNYIGVEFEPHRKYDELVGGENITFWPGVLVIVPAM
jgi:GNAT superfamily N-acetyltransferase